MVIRGDVFVTFAITGGQAGWGPCAPFFGFVPWPSAGTSS